VLVGVDLIRQAVSVEVDLADLIALS